MKTIEKMSEAEVGLRLAFFLIRQGLAVADVRVAIDGAQVKTSNTIHFALAEFLREQRWVKAGPDDVWQGTYAHAQHRHHLVIHSRPGLGDVVAELVTGQTLRAECKKGSVVRSERSQEYPALREALGQLLTVEEVGDRDLFAVAVPHSSKTVALCGRWRQAPLVQRSGICLLTVSRDDEVFGLPMTGSAYQGPLNLDDHPTMGQLRGLIANADDDAGLHVLWANRTGEVELSRLPRDASPEELERAHPEMQARFAAFLPGNEYVGTAAAADEEWISELFASLLREWPKAKGTPHVAHLDLY
jgi:hypothetical protein